MKKAAYILAAAMLIATMAGCNNNSDDSKTTTADGNSTHKVTQVAVQEMEAENTTGEAIEYLKTQVPLFAKYVEKRNSLPLTYEVEITTGGVVQTASINIKDDKNVSFLSTDADGKLSGTIYTGNKCYVISEAEKNLYISDVTEETCKEVVEVNLMNIDVAQAKAMTYSADTAEYNGTTYKHEVISTPAAGDTHYYFDMNTEELVYIVSGQQVTKITKFSNTVNEAAFDLPSGYTEVDLNKYVNDTLDAAKAEAEAAKAE